MVVGGDELFPQRPCEGSNKGRPLRKSQARKPRMPSSAHLACATEVSKSFRPRATRQMQTRTRRMRSRGSAGAVCPSQHGTRFVRCWISRRILLMEWGVAILKLQEVGELRPPLATPINPSQILRHKGARPIRDGEESCVCMGYIFQAHLKARAGQLAKPGPTAQRAGSQAPGLPFDPFIWPGRHARNHNAAEWRRPRQRGRGRGRWCWSPGLTLAPPKS